jgi:type I restriction enzyme S subunit
MASEWAEVPFADAIDFQEGPGIMAVDFGDDGVPLIRLAGLEREGSVLAGCNYLDPIKVNKHWSHFRLREGDILLSSSASLGRIAVVGPEAEGAIPYTGIIRMRPRDERVFAPFIRYLLEAPDFQRQAEIAGVGSVMRHFRPMHLRQMSVLLPPFAEQVRIAGILGALDDKIELNRQMSQTLEATARALFKSWFVDFDPVRAKAEGRDPGLSARIAGLFPEAFEDSELGDIPAGWNVATLGDVAVSPRRPVRPSELDAATPYIGLEHMPRKSIALAEWGNAGSLESGKAAFCRGEILFGKLRPYFHKVGVAPTDGVCSTDIVVLTSKSEAWYGFVAGHVSSDAFVAYTNAGSTGTRMPRTSWAEMARYPVALPPAAVGAAFTDRVGPMIERILASVHETRTLAAVRDALLPRLVSGELSITKAEQVMEAVR